jgi:signal transduction histidine kinase
MPSEKAADNRKQAMTDDTRSPAIEGVRFYGAMTASVCHEIKNVLAIINENTGLLQDMLAMNAKGVPLDPARLAKLARSLGRQVSRGDGIVKNLSTFAHNADHLEETVDVYAEIQFVVDLAGRLIAVQGPPPKIPKPSAPVTLAANRFFLENLIWACLRRAMRVCGHKKQVTIIVEKDEAAVRIRFQGLAADLMEKDSVQWKEEVCRMIGAKIIADTNRGEIALVFNEPA